MTKTKWMAVGVVLVLTGAWSADAQVPGGDPGFALGSRQLVTHFQEQPNGPTTLTVVEPQSHVIAVYHIARDTGVVKLQSVRNFELDLRLPDYNGAGLKPDDIRKMLELSN